MPYGTILSTGSFISTGAPYKLPCVQGASLLNVYNKTEAAAANANHGVEYFWQLGMDPDDCRVSLRNAGANAMNTTTAITLGVPGVNFIDTSLAITTTYAGTAVQAISADPTPRVTAAAFTTLATGDIVRLYNVVGGQQLGAIDFTVTYINGTHFDLTNMSQIVAAAAPGATAVWRKVFDPYFYPVHRYISRIAQGANPTTTLVTLTVTHNYQIGQQVRFDIPPTYGMTQLNGVQGTIIDMGIADAVGATNTILVNTSVAGFTPFVFPLSGAAPFSPAMVVPIGMNTSEALYPVPPLPAIPPYDNLTDATLNTASKYLLLGAGITSPAGSQDDVIYWSIGTSIQI